MRPNRVIEKLRADFARVDVISTAVDTLVKSEDLSGAAQLMDQLLGEVRGFKDKLDQTTMEGKMSEEEINKAGDVAEEEPVAEVVGVEEAEPAESSEDVPASDEEAKPQEVLQENSQVSS